MTRRLDLNCFSLFVEQEKVLRGVYWGGVGQRFGCHKTDFRNHRTSRRRSRRGSGASLLDESPHLAEVVERAVGIRKRRETTARQSHSKHSALSFPQKWRNFNPARGKMLGPAQIPRSGRGKRRPSDVLVRSEDPCPYSLRASSWQSLRPDAALQGHYRRPRPPPQARGAAQGALAPTLARLSLPLLAMRPLTRQQTLACRRPAFQGA